MSTQKFDLSNTERWSSKDYLLRNQFCPPEVIQAELDQIRAALEVSWLALVAFDFRDKLSSLFYASAEQSLVRASFLERALVADWRRPLGKTEIDDDDQTAVDRQEILDFVNELATEDQARPAVAIRSRPQLDSDPIGLIGCWIVAPACDQNLISQSALESLTEMLNGTVVANSHRGGRITDLIAAPAKAADYGLTLAGLLGLAVRANIGSVAAYYSLIPREGVLRRRAIVPPDHNDAALPDVVNLADRGEEGHSAQIRNSYFRSRLFAWSDGPPSGVPSSKRHFAAVPVPAAPLWGPGNNAGVFLCTNEERAFGLSDVSLLRDLAFRISLQAQLEATRQSASLLTNIARDLSTGSSVAGSELDLIPDDASIEVPSDIDRVRESLKNIVRHAWETTGSDSVTFRALVPGSDPKGPSWLLRRFVSAPETRMEMPGKDIAVVPGPTDERREPWRFSLNSWAAHEGQMAYVWDKYFSLDNQVKGLLALEQVSSNTRCELSIPVFVDGTLTGTMNFESSMPALYTDQLSSIASLAAMAGFAISAGRRDIVRAISQRFSLLRRGYHESSLLTAEMARIERQVPPKSLSKLQEILQIIRPDQAVRFPKKTDQPQSLAALVAAACVGNGEIANILSNRVDPNISLSTETSQSVLAALKDVMKNVHESSAALLSARSREIFLGGKKYQALTIANDSASEFANRENLERLYKSPLPGDAARRRPHLGCFTVGEIVRNLGGDVFAEITPDHLLETHFLIPIGEENASDKSFDL